MQKKVLIVGGGIAGCSAAMALARFGWQVRVVEKEPVWRFQSSGIFVYSNGLASFDQLGVADELIASGFAVPSGRNVYLDAQGRHITDVFYPNVAPRPMPPILGIKRAEMHRVLSAQLARWGVSVQLGVTVTGLTQSAQHVEVSLSDGSLDHFELVLGADGIRSSIRALLWPDVQPLYSGFGIWRSVHSRPPELVDKIMMMGLGQRMGIMPISDDKLYIFGTLAEPRDSWFDKATWPQTMRTKLAEFGGPARQFLDEVSDQTEVLYTAVEEVMLPGPWHRGRVLLIGDAAHASTPFMGQGGAMAVQDAVELARMLAKHDEQPLSDVLHLFGQRRAPMCQFVQEASRRVGQAGAQRDATVHEQMLVNMPVAAQAHVDGFYRTLRELMTT